MPLASKMVFRCANRVSNSFLSGVDFYSGEEKVEYKLGVQGCFNFK
jgi:hypothetical protein